MVGLNMLDNYTNVGQSGYKHYVIDIYIVKIFVGLLDGVLWASEGAIDTGDYRLTSNIIGIFINICKLAPVLVHLTNV